MELKSGKVMWSQPELTRSSLLYVDGRFLCLTEYGDLLILKANSEKFDVQGQIVLRTGRRAPSVPSRPNC